ncbi:MAG: hypothetical protein A3F22_02525 [Candidatus Magasanikbacteria bacterium RIFCSPHIGHO2_12_FULL_41_16]|nr:MAG: hypothetical protein A3F22_02525 [Candidatus Magasanikbacteria bacterium RIFCSPHIGHO2_12_FULL_41_16]
MNMNKKGLALSSSKGFTLIELLVVIAIIALLSTLAVIALGSARKKANDAKRLSDMTQIRFALESYFTKRNTYPTTLPAGVVLGVGNATCLNTTGFAVAGCAEPLMAIIPRDPGAGTYVYSSNNGKTYKILASLEAGTDTLKPGAIAVDPFTIKNGQ